MWSPSTRCCDVQILHDKGRLIAADWQSRLPHDSSPYYSLPAFLVRKGNPEGREGLGGPGPRRHRGPVPEPEGRRALDALVDLPFALPTAVAGIALSTSLLARQGWFGQWLEPLGLKVAYTPIGIAVAMAFTSLPFVVRTVQPVLQDLDAEVEEAARALGASDPAIVPRVILPELLPALLAGWALAFARSLGEFGAVIFIAGNQPFRTEITSLLAFIRLEEFEYPAAAALAMVILGAAFVMLVIVNLIQAYHLRYAERPA